MKTLYKIVLQLLLFSLSGIILSNLGCESNAPNSPSTDVVKIRSTGQLQFLKPQKIRFNKGFQEKQNISASNGGTILVGDEISGFSSINFKSGDLNYDAVITFGWDSQGYFTRLSPHGIQFNNPVRLVLSYKDADLTNVDENNIQIWYYNDLNNSWELIGGEVNKDEKQVEGYIWHFSKYALADDD